VSCREVKTKLSKIDPFFFRYTAKPDLRHLSDQDRLDPEPGRTPAPRMGLVRLSRNTQDMRLQLPVKRKPEDFSRGRTRFHANSALVNFSSIPHSDGVAGRHVLENLQLVDFVSQTCLAAFTRSYGVCRTKRWVPAKANRITGDSRSRRYFRRQAVR
jgi:hypothetical protein